jgi:uncharacterized membrane protein YheB (UPF0754 family)
MNEEILHYLFLGAIPIVSGAIGWLTNWVAVKMLLHPLRPKVVLGVKFQGLIPRRIEDLASRIAISISRDFLTVEDIGEMIEKVELKPFLSEYIKNKWDEKLDVILGAFPMIKMMVPQDKLDGIRDKVIESFTEGEGDIGSAIAEAIQDKVDLEEVIRTNILAFDLSQLDSIINEIAKKEFRFIEILGGVIGFIIGLFQVLLVQFAI